MWQGDGDASAAVQAAIVTVRACRTFRADIAEPLSAHYNATGHDREIPAALALDTPVRGRAAIAESGSGRESP